jgi:hypothetical protein
MSMYDRCQMLSSVLKLRSWRIHDSRFMICLFRCKGGLSQNLYREDVPHGYRHEEKRMEEAGRLTTWLTGLQVLLITT